MAQLLSGTDSDVMAALLRDVRVSSTVYCRSDMGAPWGFGVRARDQAAFHAVASGRCWLEVEGGGESTRLQQGDLVLLPRGHMHWLRDDPASPAEWLEDLLASNPVDGGRTMTSGGDGERTVIVWGPLRSRARGTIPCSRRCPP